MEEEAELTATMIKEINEKFQTDLAVEVRNDKTILPFRQPRVKFNFLFVGASHPTRTADEVTNLGYTTRTAKVPGWRATDEDIAKMKVEIQKILEENEVETVVFQCLDNASFFGEDANGLQALATTDENGRYHLQRHLSIITRTE